MHCVKNWLSAVCVILSAMPAAVTAQPVYSDIVRQGVAPSGGYRFHSGAPVVTIRPTTVTVVSGTGRHTRVACRKGQRLTFDTPQMTQDSIVHFPNGRRGFIHTRDIKLVPGWQWLGNDKDGMYVKFSPRRAGVAPA